jgi:8-oxo-dGTP diphosphatase
MPDPEPVYVVGAAILREGRCLVARRSAAMSAPLCWEFPGGKVEGGELPRQALVREIREELGVEIAAGDWLGRGEQVEGDRVIVLDVYAAELRSGEPLPHEHDACEWVVPEELRRLDWALPDVPIVERVLERLSR